MRSLLRAIVVAFVLFETNTWATFPVVDPERAAQQPVFRSTAREVALFVTVRGRDGRLLTGLDKDAFEVVDSGVPVPISTFSNAPVPITAVIMADVSGSMGVDFLRVRVALLHFVETLGGGDRIRIGTFGDEVALGWSLTNDKEVLRQVIADEFWPGGDSPLWRAVDTAATALAPEVGRKVVVVITDGVDYSPGGTQGLPPLPGGFRGLMSTIERSQDLIVYAVGFADPGLGQNLRGDIVTLARASGGGHTDVRPDADLGGVLDDIGRQLRQQYVVGFVPRHQDGRDHSVEVKVKVRGADVRSRRSYRAPGASSGAVDEIDRRWP